MRLYTAYRSVDQWLSFDRLKFYFYCVYGNRECRGKSPLQGIGERERFWRSIVMSAHWQRARENVAFEKSATKHTVLGDRSPMTVMRQKCTSLSFTETDLFCASIYFVSSCTFSAFLNHKWHLYFMVAKLASETILVSAFKSCCR